MKCCLKYKSNCARSHKNVNCSYPITRYVAKCMEKCVLEEGYLKLAYVIKVPFILIRKWCLYSISNSILFSSQNIDRAEYSLMLEKRLDIIDGNSFHLLSIELFLCIYEELHRVFMIIHLKILKIFNIKLFIYF